MIIEWINLLRFLDCDHETEVKDYALRQTAVTDGWLFLYKHLVPVQVSLCEGKLRVPCLFNNNFFALTLGTSETFIGNKLSISF